jgi:hypothetical protein
MDDTLNQFRRRLAQINGIKLDEAKSKGPSKGPEFLKKQDDSYHNMERASVLAMYHDEMRNNIRNGLSSNIAHKEAMNTVENEHGQSGIDHLHGHFSDLAKDYRYS